MNIPVTCLLRSRFELIFRLIPYHLKFNKPFVLSVFFSLCKSVFSRPFELCRNLTVGMRTE